MKNTHTITKAIYKSFAEQIAEDAIGRNYISDVFYVTDKDVEHRLELSLIIYRDRRSGEVTDIADVWWDSYTIETNEDGEPVLKINDFDMKLLYKELMGR